MSTTTTLARSMSNTLARMAWLPIIGTRLSAASNILWATADRLERAERDEAEAYREASQMRGELSDALGNLESTRHQLCDRMSDIALRDGIIANQQEQHHRLIETITDLQRLLDVERERNARLVLQLGQRRKA
jgi:hypothetical protein